MIEQEGWAVDQGPGDIVGPLVWQKISEKIAAAPRNDLPPGRRIALESLALERIDLVTDEACDEHLQSLVV